MAKRANSEWLPRVLFESVLITVSILVALGLDQWNDNRQDDEAVEQALTNFVREIDRNSARVAYAAPFNKGLLDVLRMRSGQANAVSVQEFVNYVESYEPIDLQSTAWETALATGSLAKMDYDLVSALSLTYSLQNRYQEATRTEMAEMTNPQNLSEDRIMLSIYNIIRFLEDVNSMESDLIDTYDQASKVIKGDDEVTAEPDESNGL